MLRFCFVFFVLNLGWFWGDPHFKTLDGGNYTFNGLGEYVMIDAQNGTFQLQARTGLAQGNSTTATIFIAGAAKEENTSIVEVKVKKGGERVLGCSYFGKGPKAIRYLKLENDYVIHNRLLNTAPFTVLWYINTDYVSGSTI